jgi:hypothetical protein
MFGWLKRRRLRREHEEDKDRVREEIRQWIKIGLESGIDQKPGENPPGKETLKDWAHRFLGMPCEEIILPPDQLWNVLKLKNRSAVDQ